MAANGPRFQNFPRLQQSHPGSMSGQQGAPPQSMRPMMQNVSLLMNYKNTKRPNMFSNLDFFF